MGVAVNGAARIGKVTGPPTGPRRDTTAGKPARGGLLSATAQRAILRSAGARDVSMKEARISGARGGPVELKITGWNKSKASSNPDGGVDSLIKWLEKKASTKLGSRTRSVRIKKVCCYQHADPSRRKPRLLAYTTSGPPSFAANLRTTTAIRVDSPRMPEG